MSVAPEIARLAETRLLVPGQPAALPVGGPEGPRERPDGADPAGERTTAQPTLGTLARRLRSIAAAPERWWGLVRFDPDRSFQITVEDGPAYCAWLVVLPPGDAGQSCDCDVATMIAGEATEGTSATEGMSAATVLRPGPVRVHGDRHGLRGRGTGYSISLHARAHRRAPKK
jgi:hypothetical protein